MLKVKPLSKEISTFKDVKLLSEALLKASSMTKSKGRFTNWEINQGLRVFGWTHAYNVPYLLYWLEKADLKKSKTKM